MRVFDAHCDTLTAPSPLQNAYNVSRRFPFLQCYAACVCEKKDPAGVQLAAALALYRRFHREWDGVLVTDADSLERGLASPKSALLTLEGADGVSSERDFYALCRAGMRILNPVWNHLNRFAATNRESGNAADSGLTEEGRALVRAAEKKKVLLDVSHLSDRGFEDLARLAGKPFVASHSNCRALCPHPRNLTDEQMKTLFSLGGVMGINLYPPFVKASGEVYLSDLFSHVDHALELGGEDRVGLGLDIDGVERYPRDVSLTESIHDRLFDLALVRYGKDLTKKLFYRNFAALLRRHFQ